jgi:sugar lactone lactonase YvrE
VGSVAKAGAGAAPTVPGGAALYVLEGWGGTPTKVLSGCSIANGICWSADGASMYFIDSPTFGVDAFDFDGAAPTHDALATRRRRAVAVPVSTVPTDERRRRLFGEALGQAVGAGGGPSPPIPDGCALDAAGHLWVALYGAGRICRFDVSSGALLGTVLLPDDAGVESTACAFGGPELDELYITTAYKFWRAGRGPNPGPSSSPALSHQPRTRLKIARRRGARSGRRRSARSCRSAAASSRCHSRI